ncbi:MAG: hypothetical protein JXR91_00170, partial [Deltaproteobacteria bacterium]|nr:hypothetical protein [Deltaproteobacteria bacterium]
AEEIKLLKSEIEELKKHNVNRELAELKADAESASSIEESDDDNLKNKTFKSGARSLQALNPELSVVGDIYGQYVNQNKQVYSNYGRTGFFPRVMALHLQANLDPYSVAKIAIEVKPDEVELDEAYVTWSAVTSWMSLTAGKFHQQFGVVNRWHAPSLDQFSFPLVILEHFGGPLNQTGISADFLLPKMWADLQEIELQITNGQNEKLFSGDFFSIPSALLHMRNYWDLTPDTYLEFGLTGVIGVNNQIGKTVERDEVETQLYNENGNPVNFYDENGEKVSVLKQPGETTVVNDKDWRLTAVGGGDLTINWEPSNQAKYKGFTFRSEFLYAYKQVKDALGNDREIKSFGGYSYMQVKPARSWILGVRGDFTTPFELENRDKYTWAVVPYITWWQSPWVRFRLQYNYIDWADQPKEHRVLLQMTFSAGAHKHDRY